MSFISDFQEAWIETEPPQSFFYWSGLAALSAVSKRNVSLYRQRFHLYPNIYVMLVAKSGMKKSLPPIIARDLVAAVGNTKMLDGRASFQSMLTTLGTAITPRNGGPPLVDASGFIISEEFSTAFVRDEDVMTILTKLYDSQYNKDWSNTLKGSGREDLKNVSLTMLGAMNQPHFNDIIRPKDIEGGFIARCILVHEKKRNRKNSLLRPTEKQYDPIPFVDYLKKVGQLKGEFVMEEAAIEYYEEWYYKYEPETIDDRTGLANRLPDTILKVSMLLSLSRALDLRITLEDMKEAMEKCFGLATNVGVITHGIGESKLSSQTRLVMTALLEAPDNKITRESFLRNNSGRIDCNELDQVIENYLQAGVIRPPYMDRIDGKDKLVYQLKPGIEERFQHIYTKLAKDESKGGGDGQ